MTRIRLAARDTFRSFRHRNFRVFFVGQAISMAGTWLQLIAQTLLVLRLTGSGVAVGFLAALQFLPVLVFGAFAGVLTDRVDRRRLLVVTQVVMMTSAAALGVLTLTGHATVSRVYLLALITGTANAFDNPARRVMIQELVAPDDLANATGLNSSLMTGARIVGPALATVTVLTVGLGWCFIINAVSFIAALVALARLDPTAMRRTPRVSRERGQITEGFREVWGDDDLRVAVLLMTVVATLGFNWQVVLPLFATRTLGGTETTYTMLSTILSVGSLVGSLMLARRRSVDLGLLVRLAFAYGVASLLLGLAPNLAITVVAGLVAGGFGIAYLSGTATLLQLRARPEMRGRVIALHAMLFLGTTPVGGPIAGWVAQQFGARAGVLMGAVPTVAAAVAAAAVLRRRGIGSLGGEDRLEPGPPERARPAVLA